MEALGNSLFATILQKKTQHSQIEKDPDKCLFDSSEVLQGIPSRKAIYKANWRHQHHVIVEGAARQETRAGNALSKFTSLCLALLLEEKAKEKEEKERKEG